GSRRGPVQPAEQVEQRGLAVPGAALHGQPLAVLDHQGEIPDRGDGAAALGVELGHAGQLVHRFASCRSVPVLLMPPGPARPPAPVGTTGAAGSGTPAGFWYGTDSHTVTISGSAPYRVPVIGGYYGGYIGMVGNWAVLTGCHKIVVWSAANSAQANTNHTTY